ncbi:toll/interleukin-1 receptor domain-containing protein [Aeromonas veronii]|uniref:toll/interleukin-1 receptor domain-containing protein n=1 Tax=Aeromonas veronii TaxID=654 RepID=UPI000954634D|nr:toll/interleukin-1 receptor domain-containing protein [Aeromonas veronii]MBL0588922.1 toll/interleukin-1 receptor domain-containing protein [Aeromonas veronii]SIQ07825.1 TIR domain-containing protein [Aeromonas veronii]
MAGINRARPKLIAEAYMFNKSTSSYGEKPCIFLSHNSADKEHAITIGDYIMKFADVDVYLDIYDDELQRAAEKQDAHAITTLIERGIANSTHTMCLVSENTVKSWWVPFELGYAKKSEKEICSLKLKGDITLPEYLSISPILKGTKSLNIYIERLVSTWNMTQLNNSKITTLLKSYSSAQHPLDNTLDWNE